MRDIRGRTLRPVRLAAAAVVLSAVAACGAEGTGLAGGPSAGLHEQVGAVRAAASAGDAAAARAALNAFRADVHRLVEAGELDPAEAVALLAQADRVAAGVDAEVVPAALPTPSPTPEATPRPVTRAGGEPERTDWSEVFAALIRERMREHTEDRPDGDADRDGRPERGRRGDDDRGH